MVDPAKLDEMSALLTDAARVMHGEITFGTREQWEAYDDILSAARRLFTAARRLEYEAERVKAARRRDADAERHARCTDTGRDGRCTFPDGHVGPHERAWSS